MLFVFNLLKEGFFLLQITNNTFINPFTPEYFRPDLKFYVLKS